MGGKTKRVAVLITGRQSEALRMAVGLTVLGDTVDVYLMEALVEKGHQAEMSIEALHQMGGKVYTSAEQNPFELVSTEEVAMRLAEYDAVIPY